MGLITNIFKQLELMRQTPEIITFVKDPLLRIILVGLAFGFAILLLEIRLPLKYYWDLPIFAFKRFLANLKLTKKTPVWGYCQDIDTHTIIPLAAVELLDAATKKTLQTTYSNHLGQYGFSKVKPGTYIMRAVKNYYQMPPFYDPENIKLIRVDESYAAEVTVTGDNPPHLNLPLQKISSFNPSDPKSRIKHLFKTFSLNLSNGLLALAVLGSLYGWAVTQELLYGVLIVVGVTLLFVKIYILETIGEATSS